jgi:Protein of unknown function (DUF3588).
MFYYECTTRVLLLIAVCIFVNHGCSCGPYLDPRKVANLPMVFNGKRISRVLKECVQSLVDAALDQKQIFGLLRQGEGRVVITGERLQHCPVHFKCIKCS